ncbi:hypothetical protein [Staphylococcus phage vB_SsapH-Golestan-100]|nr:hypothetical protein [Staphylococcus phage vB_SsapH-Golestan-100]
MEFFIDRTSTINKKPIEGSYIKKLEEVDQKGNPFTIERWCVEINSLEELAELSNQEGEVIINTRGDSPFSPYLEIYDYYRE